MDRGVRRVISDRVAHARPGIAQQPSPEIPPLARAQQRTPGAQNDRDIEEDHRVCCAQPNLDGVIWTQVAVHDPRGLGDQCLLDRDPLLAWRRGEAGAPEDFVQLDHGQSRDLPQSPRERRLTGCARTEDDNAFQLVSEAFDDVGGAGER